MVLDLPNGRRLKKVVELIGKQNVAFKPGPGAAHIQVEIDCDTPARLYWFELE
jgi:hypothetical protein